MLPLPTSSRSSSPTLSSSPLAAAAPSLASAKLAIHSLPAPLRPYALRLRALDRSHPLKTRLAALVLLLVALYSLLGSLVALVFPAPTAHTPLAWGTHPDAVLNYGDYVGLGLAREKALAATPKDYADITDRLPRLDRELGGPLYRRRRSRGEREAGEKPMDLSEGGKDKGGRKKGTGKERHGTLGGASVEWSTGVVGSGVYLGPVDMRKDAPSSPPPSPSAVEAGTSPALDALSAHMLAKGWVYLDVEDKENTAKLLLEAKEKDFLDSLPLRERVREDPKGRKEAAEGWARIYAAEAQGGWPKSALEVQLERLARRSPVVVFSKTTCPFSRRAKQALERLQLYPAPHIVEVDLRPDAPAIKGLLARRTRHDTYPNILIGSRSIGGADDLDALLSSAEGRAELKGMLDEVGVVGDL
ncbi:hypothetical protein JCM8097_008698 [Rhodosporidiobolus ruineniae]